MYILCFYFNNSIFCVHRYFLSTNTFYDELLAINIAGQTYLWEVLHHLATQRSLYSEMLDILMKTVQMFGVNDVCPKSCNVYIYICTSIIMCMFFTNKFQENITNIWDVIWTYVCILDGLLICLSESDLMQAIILNHDLARAHMLFVRSNLRESQIFVLQVRNLNL